MTPKTWQEAGHFATYRKHAIFFRTEGHGEDLIALHGFPTSSWDWHCVWPRLAQHYRLLAPDFVGFGLSAKPINYRYSIFDQADLVEVLAAQRGVTHAHILAHDYGDTVAQELLARQADGKLAFTILSVCLLNGGIIPSKHRPVLMQRLLHSPVGRFIGPLMTKKTLTRSFKAIFGPSTQPTAEEMEGYWYFVAHNEGPRIVHLLIRYIAERRANQDRWVGVLRDPGVPVRLIFGASDPISGRHMTDAYRRIAGRPEDVIDLPHIGHYPQVEASDEVAARILEFLESMGSNTSRQV